MKTIGEQAREFRTGKGWSTQEMAAAVSRQHPDGPVSRQVIEQLEKAGARRPRYLAALAKIMGTTVETLEAGAYTFGRPEKSNVTPAAVGACSIPLISYVQAGCWTDVVDSFAPGAGDEYLLTDLELSSSAFALKIKGDSMLPEFKEGDRVIIDPAVSPLPGDYVVAKNGEEEATFKKYRPRGTTENGQPVFELVPLNEDYETLRSDRAQIRIVGTMVEHRKYRRR